MKSFQIAVICFFLSSVCVLHASQEIEPSHNIEDCDPGNILKELLEKYKLDHSDTLWNRSSSILNTGEAFFIYHRPSDFSKTDMTSIATSIRDYFHEHFFIGTKSGCEKMVFTSVSHDLAPGSFIKAHFEDAELDGDVLRFTTTVICLDPSNFAISLHYSLVKKNNPASTNK